MEYEETKRLKENSKSSLSVQFFFDENDELTNMAMETNGVKVEKFVKKYNISKLFNILVKIEQKGLEVELEKKQQQIDRLFKKPFLK